MQNALSAPRENNGKKLDRLYVTVLKGMLETSSKVDQPLASKLAKEVSELCPGRDTITRNWNN